MNKNLPVSAIMTVDVITLHPEDSLNIVEETFAAKSFHHIPIVDVNQKVQGMVSKMDLLQLSAIKRDIPEKEFKFMKVKNFMTRSLVTVDPDTTIGRVAEIFFDNRFHALPVVQDEKILGIVTTHDLLNVAFDLKPVANIEVE